MRQSIVKVISGKGGEFEVANHLVNTLNPGDPFRDWLVKKLSERLREQKMLCKRF